MELDESRVKEESGVIRIGNMRDIVSVGELGDGDRMD